MGLFSKDIATLDDLFVHTLQDIYYAEHQISKSLPKMIAKATAPALRNGFELHLKETEGQIARLEKVFEKLPCRLPVCLVDELGDRELAGAVDADEQVELAFGGLHLSDIDVEETNRVAFEELTLWLVTFDVRQARDTMPLQAPVQR